MIRSLIRFLRDPVEIERRAPVLAAVLGVLLAADVAFYTVLTRPRLLRAYNAEDILKRKEGDVAEARREVERLERRLSKIRCADRDLRRFEEEIVGGKPERMTAVRREIRQIAREFNLDPLSVTYGDSPLRGTDLTKFTISFPLVGSYASLRQFLQRVEASRHFLVVDEVTLSGAREGGVGVSLSVGMATYFRASGAGGAAAPEPPAAAPPAGASPSPGGETAPSEEGPST